MAFKYENIVIFVQIIKKNMYEFSKNEKNTQQHTDTCINIIDIMYAKQEFTCLNTFGTGDKNVMSVE